MTILILSKIYLSQKLHLDMQGFWLLGLLCQKATKSGSCIAGLHVRLRSKCYKQHYSLVVAQTGVESFSW
jgi:hypothetical protein